VALKDFGLAGAALRKKSINLAEDLSRLALNVFAQVLGDNPRQVDGLTVLYRLRKYGALVMSRDVHKSAPAIKKMSAEDPRAGLGLASTAVRFSLEIVTAFG
jgi:hypothetical protein